MSHEDFNSAFRTVSTYGLPLSLSPDAGALVSHIVRRDRRRTWLLAGLSLACWLLGTAGMLLLVYGLDRLVIFIRISDVVPGQGGTAAATHPLSHQAAQMLYGTSLLHHSLPIVGGSIVALLLAAMFTVLLVFSSRQATLNRINISLMQLSEQLKQMRGAGGGGEGVGGRREAGGP